MQHSWEAEHYSIGIRQLEEHFDGLEVEHVPRAEKNIADDLSKRATLKLLVEPGEGVLDYGVLGQPDYILWLDCWTMKIQD